MTSNRKGDDDVFDFHNVFFCLSYIIVSFCFVLGLYFKIVFFLIDEKRILGHLRGIVITYTVGVSISIFITYYLFQFVRFIQFYY